VLERGVQPSATVHQGDSAPGGQVVKQRS
jgi:hypothetical protein